MAVKTITIDVEAYEILSRRKRPGQSFSQVIKEHFDSKKTARDLLNAAQGIVLSEQTLNAVERQVKQRGKSIAKPVRL